MNFKGPSLWRGARSIHNPLFDKINCNLHYKYFLFVNNKYLLSHSQWGKLKSRCDTSKSTQSWKWCSFNSSLDLSTYIHIYIFLLQVQLKNYEAALSDIDLAFMAQYPQEIANWKLCSNILTINLAYLTNWYIYHISSNIYIMLKYHNNPLNVSNTLVYKSKHSIQLF